jgi:pimeloyl-ACP methyl ester carboxylesterase
MTQRQPHFIPSQPATDPKEIRMQRTLIALALAAALGGTAVQAFAQTKAPAVATTADARTSTQASLRADVDRAWAQRGFKTQTVRANGAQFYVATAGTGPALLLLHGYPQSNLIWRDVAPALAREFTVIAPDLRGMGLSSKTADGYDLFNITDDMRAVVKALGHERVAIAGHDWGASVGYVYAARHPGEVVRFAFLDSAVPGAGFESFFDFSKKNAAFEPMVFSMMSGTAESLVAGREHIYMRHLWQLFTGDKARADWASWQPYVRMARQPGAFTGGANYYRALYRSAEQVTPLTATPLPMPVMTITGGLSTGPYGEQLMKKLARDVRKSLVLEGVGHFVTEERPAEVAQALQAFFAER